MVLLARALGAFLSALLPIATLAALPQNVFIPISPVMGLETLASDSGAQIMPVT